VVNTDVGGAVFQVQQTAAVVHQRRPRSMGFGLPAAMGAQAAFPQKTVIDIDGDGSF